MVFLYGAVMKNSYHAEVFDWTCSFAKVHDSQARPCQKQAGMDLLDFSIRQEFISSQKLNDHVPKYHGACVTRCAATCLFRHLLTWDLDCVMEGTDG